MWGADVLFLMAMVWIGFVSWWIVSQIKDNLTKINNNIGLQSKELQDSIEKLRRSNLLLVERLYPSASERLSHLEPDVPPEVKMSALEDDLNPPSMFTFASALNYLYEIKESLYSLEKKIESLQGSQSG